MWRMFARSTFDSTFYIARNWMKTLLFYCTASNPCNSDPCDNGVCVQSGNSYTCSCPPNYTGARCELGGGMSLWLYYSSSFWVHSGCTSQFAAEFAEYLCCNNYKKLVRSKAAFHQHESDLIEWSNRSDLRPIHDISFHQRADLGHKSNLNTWSEQVVMHAWKRST